MTQHKDTPESFWERMRAIHGPDYGPPPPDLETRAQRAFYEEVEGVKWEDLTEWQRESWRCEVDPDRDPDRIIKTKEVEDGP